MTIKSKIKIKKKKTKARGDEGGREKKRNKDCHQWEILLDKGKKIIPSHSTFCKLQQA